MVLENLVTIKKKKYIYIYIYIYTHTYKEHLVEIIYTLVGGELLKKINFKLAKPQN